MFLTALRILFFFAIYDKLGQFVIALKFAELKVSRLGCNRQGGGPNRYISARHLFYGSGLT